MVFAPVLGARLINGQVQRVIAELVLATLPKNGMALRFGYHHAIALVRTY